MTDQPICATDSYGKEWYLNGKLHREDGPAIERANGSKEWHLNGKRHREDGPAIEWSSGTKDWYLNGEKYDKESYIVEMNRRKLEKWESLGKYEEVVDKLNRYEMMEEWKEFDVYLKGGEYPTSSSS